MVLIQPGSFDMGSPPTEPKSRIDEKQHRVTISRPFMLAATEVTKAAWVAVMGRDPCYFPDCDDCPVERVSWFDAVNYCNALSAREGLGPAYRIDAGRVTWLADSDGFRLPTEAEWEYACRAGTSSAYSSGPCLTSEQANYNAYNPLPGCPEGLNRGETIPVASFPANAWGLHDMHGNISEWCWDRYADYADAPATDPTGPASGEERVVRGGCWANFGPKCRAANRESQNPAKALDMIGLRVARSIRRGDAGAAR
jgi:formylglycine-generating enzyme required for sulfatase activity